MNKLILSLFVMILFIGMASAYLPHPTNTSLEFSVTSDNATQCNVTNLDKLSSTIYINQIMNKSGQTFNATINESYFNLLGNYCFNIVCTDGSEYKSGSVCREVTASGEQFNTNQTTVLFGLAVLVALFFGIGLSFKDKKWKVRTFFFMASSFMGIILLNSVRIVMGSSSSLSSMGNIGLIVGIIVLAFLFLYLLIYWTIETFNYFKDKKKMKWEVNNNAYS